MVSEDKKMSYSSSKKERRETMRKAVVLYWSHTGNTEKVAMSIHKGLGTADLIP